MEADLVALVRRLARSTAFAVGTRRQGPLDEAREGLAKLIVGVDLRIIDKSSAAYAVGAHDAFAMLVSALTEQTLSDETRKLLLKRARVLNAVVAYPRFNQKRLATQLGLRESNLTTYLRELADAGLVERTAPAEGSGQAWALTPWGFKAWEECAANPAEHKLPELELSAAQRVLGRLPAAIPQSNRPTATQETSMARGASVAVEETTQVRAYSDRQG